MSDPLVVFGHGIERLVSKLLATRGLKDKLRVLVKPPSGEPDSRQPRRRPRRSFGRP